MKTSKFIAAAAMAGTAATLLPGLAVAHVTLEPSVATAGAPLRLALLVNHGCQGSATQAITVRLPAGLRGARAMAKPGWTVTLQRAAPAAASATASAIAPAAASAPPREGPVTEIRWQASGRDAQLPDALFDEFVLRAQAPATPGPLWFKVLQQCEQGQSDWAELPAAAAGTSTQGLKTPALLLDVLAPPSSAGADGHAGHQH